MALKSLHSDWGDFADCLNELFARDVDTVVVYVICKVPEFFLVA